MIESAILCDEAIDDKGNTSLIFCSELREKNEELIQPYTRWFGVHTELKAQYERTKRSMERSERAVKAGLEGILRDSTTEGGKSH
jgi:hypothetical protein